MCPVTKSKTEMVPCPICGEMLPLVLEGERLVAYHNCRPNGKLIQVYSKPATKPEDNG